MNRAACNPIINTTVAVQYEELQWNDKPLYFPGETISTNVDCMDQNQIHSNKMPNNTKLAPIPIHAGSTALLIIDVQPEYWSLAPAVRKDFPLFEENIQRAITLAREKKVKIIWVRADYRKAHSPWLAQFERLNLMANGGKMRADTITELPYEPDSDEFAWEEFATPEEEEAIITKSSWSSTSNTALMDILRMSGIDTVLVCGLITSVCVQHSAFGVFEAGYRTILVKDACGDRGKARHEAALALYGGYMYELMTSLELADCISPNGMRKVIPTLITMSRTMPRRSSCGRHYHIDSNMNAKKQKISYCTETETDVGSPVVNKDENCEVCSVISRCSSAVSINS